MKLTEEEKLTIEYKLDKIAERTATLEERLVKHTTSGDRERARRCAEILDNLTAKLGGMQEVLIAIGYSTRIHEADGCEWYELVHKDL